MLKLLLEVFAFSPIWTFVSYGIYLQSAGGGSEGSLPDLGLHHSAHLEVVYGALSLRQCNVWILSSFSEAEKGKKNEHLSKVHLKDLKKDSQFKSITVAL